MKLVSTLLYNFDISSTFQHGITSSINKIVHILILLRLLKLMNKPWKGGLKLRTQALLKEISFGRVFLLPCGKRQIELLFPVTSGETGRIAVDLGDVRDARTLQRQLRNSGFEGAPITREYASALDDLVVRYAKSAKGRAALTPVRLSGGWNESRTSFALGDFEIPTGTAVARPPRAGAPVNAKRGTLSGWKSSVGKLAPYSSRVMLMISAALAAPTLSISGTEAGGFGVNLWGPSSTGKSTALRAAASVLAGDFAASWNGTAIGLQDLAQEFNDLPLTVDSMESLSGEAQKELTEVVAYTLGNGKARVRAKAWSAAGGATDTTWRTVLLSTAEAKSRRAQKTGSAVRLVDVPVSRDLQDGVGIVDTIPDRIPAERRRAFAAEFVVRLAKAVQAHHGHVLPAFIADLAKNPELARTRLAASQREFVAAFGTSGLSNADLRVLGHFAMVYAAGRLGIEFGLLPWKTTDLLAAIQLCAHDALENSNDRAKRNAENAGRVLAWLSDPARKLIDYSPALTKAEIMAADALTAEVAREDSDTEYRSAIMVLRPVLQRAIGIPGKELTAAMTHLQKLGRLATEGRADALTVQNRYADCSARSYIVYI